MTGPTHVVVGFASTFVLAKSLGLELGSLALFAVFLGSLAPDIDGDGAITRPGRLFRNFIPRLIGALIDTVTEFVTELCEKIFGHRGFFHWPILGLAMASYGAWTGMWPLFWFGWAYLWHILADALTVQGVPLLAPIFRRSLSIGFFRTGSPLEAVFAAGVFCVMVSAGFAFLPFEVQRHLGEFLPIERFAGRGSQQ